MTPDAEKRHRLAMVMVLFSAFTILSCHKQYLRGHYTDREAFFRDCEWKTEVDSGYKAKSRWMDSLKTLKARPDVRIYLGTYCPDSKKWTPRFFALQDSLPLGRVDIISVDTTKRDDEGLALADSLKKIPTFIFLKNGKEMARITEKPRGRIEKALYQSLKKCE